MPPKFDELQQEGAAERTPSQWRPRAAPFVTLESFDPLLTKDRLGLAAECDYVSVEREVRLVRILGSECGWNRPEDSRRRPRLDGGADVAVVIGEKQIDGPCHVVESSSRKACASDGVKLPRLPRATWSSPRPEARDAFEPRPDGVGR